MTILKNLLIAILTGLVAYEIARFLLEGGIAIPATTSEISLLLLFVATSFFSLVLAACFQDTGGFDIFADDRETGTVKWFNLRKGYGFITRDQGDDVFVHFRSIEGRGDSAISEGERVTFIVSQSEKGPQAERVRPE